MRLLLLTLLIFVIFACNNSVDKSVRQSASTEGADTTVTQNSVAFDEAVNNVVIDTAEYKREIRLDTLITVDNHEMAVSVMLKFDSSHLIRVPEKYVSAFGMQRFEVFESYVKAIIKKDGRTIQDTVITKNGFAGLADSSLRAYGNLGFPTVRRERNVVEIGLSFSIPCTDVGIPASVRFVLE